MTDEQLRQFNMVRQQYLRDLDRLRKHYLKMFIKILKPAE